MNRRPIKTSDRPSVIGHSPSVIPRRRRGGFALLITITLLAFLVLLLVSLASLTRVETQVATNSQQLSQARQNALMALNIAIGQLQKYAGPDQRTTAQADINPALTRQPNSRWTGVYGSSVAANYAATPDAIPATLTDATKVNATTGCAAQLLTWLVSGNETAPFNPATDVGSSGQIVTVPSASVIPYQPSQIVQNLAPITASTDTNIKITNNNGPQPAQLLVGSGSTNTDIPITGSSTTVPVDYVVAPLVNIQMPASQIPGLSGTDPTTIGRYAWWVGDEGVKARVNLPLSTSADPAILNNAFVTPTRAAVELMSGTTATSASGPITSTSDAPIGATAYTINLAPGIVSPPQLPLLNTASTTLPIFSKNRFHDLTAASYSVLSDTYAGGLKKDLTRLLIDGQSTTTDLISTTATSPLFPFSTADNATSNYVPTWGYLRSYTQLTTQADGTLPVRLPTLTQAGISPVLTYFSLGYRYATNGPLADGSQVQVQFYPIVVLWNPYTVPIQAHTYEVGIAPAPYGAINVKLQNSPDGQTWTDVPKTGCNFTSITSFTTSSNGTNTEYVIFGLKCPQIAPGQSLIFSIPPANSGQAYSNIGTNAPQLTNDVYPSTGNYVTLSLPGGTIPSGQSSYNYRVLSTSFFTNGGGGVLNMYLGEPSSKTAIKNYDSNYNPYTTGKQWYQTNQGIGWDNISVPGSVNQTGLFSNTDVSNKGPCFVFYAQAVFSGQGSNGAIDSNNGASLMLPSRWIAQGNMRAPITARTRLDTNYNVLYSANAGLNSAYAPWLHIQTGVPPSSPPYQVSAGLGHDWDLAASTPIPVTLFEVRPNTQPNFFSIGQLQQAPLSTIGAYPSYAVGNSLADFHLNSGTMLTSTGPAGGTVQPLTNQKAYYDISWLLNRTLWDRYYFSTVPGTGALPATLPNPRLVSYNSSSSALQNVDQAAANLLVSGGFNINSTSQQAWRAVLGGVSRLGYDPVGRTSTAQPAPGAPATSPLSRFSQPTASSADPSGTDPTSVWQGYRTLTAQQIAQLASDIVTEIRARGPFISLADFINRRLVDTSTTAPNAFGLKGTLQAALDNRLSTTSTTYATNDAASGSFWATYSATPVASGTQYKQQIYFGANHTLGNLGTALNPVSNRSAYAPKYLTQADILSTLGSTLSARSDTFRIRTYGEARNPVTQAIQGSAWCEAIVQRVPDYVEPSVAASATPASGSLSQLFGRKFKIISFRWLSPSDI